MGDRTVPYDPNAKCDICGALGAYDFMGDMICARCAAPPNGLCEECEVDDE